MHHLRRRIAQELRRLDAAPVFFASDAEPFLDGRDWATLIELSNEDFAALGSEPAVPEEPTQWLLDRYDRAALVGGIEPRLLPLPRRLMGQVRQPRRTVISDRELEVLRLVAKGNTNKEIATELFISEATVKTHLLHVYEKLEANDRASAVARGFELGLLSSNRGS